jgi:hypothetical protein
LTPKVLSQAPGTGLEAIQAGAGISIAITGMLIVFFALALISLFIRLLPVVLVWLEPILPTLKSHDSGATPTASPKATEQLPQDLAKRVAAIGFVLHTEIRKATQHK